MPISSSVPEASKPAADAREETPSDAVLLKTFRNRKDEAAFTTLVKRYGEMVFAVALRILRDRHAAEDVFQATFLVLARDAQKVRRPESLAAWLHGIALRMAKKSLKRRRRDRTLEPDMEPLVEEPMLEEMALLFQRQLLDEELQKLPETYREPLVLHFLQGKTYEETAQVLGTTVGAIEGRLKRGKRELQLRLMRRGVGMGVAIAAIHWSQSAAHASIQPQLVSAAVQGGMAIAQGTSFAPACSSEAVHLAAKETAMFTTAKVAATVCSLLAATSLGWAVHAGFTGEPGPGSAHANPIQGLALTQLGNSREGVAFEAGNSANQEAGSGTSANAPAEAETGFEAPGGTGASSAVVQQEPGQLEVSAVQPEGALMSVLDDLKGELTIVSLPGTNRFAVRGSQEDVASFVDAVRQVEQLEKNASDDAARVNPSPQTGKAGTEPNRELITVEKAFKPGDIRIQEELLNSTSLDFKDRPLSDVVHFIEQTHGIPIRLDGKALADAGVEETSNITLQVKDIPLEDALHLLMKEVDGAALAYLIRDEMLHITTAEEADKVYETRVYDVSSLALDDVRSLIDAVENGTEGPWYNIDGLGGILNYVNGKLVVRQTQQAHREIEQLLNELAASMQPSDGKVVRKEFDPSEADIEKELQRTTKIEFPGNPLDQVLNLLSVTHNFPIRIDEAALSKAKIEPGAEVSLVLSDVTLESALNLLLEEAGGGQLAYVVHDGIMEITTAREAEWMRDTRVYDLRPLGLTETAPLVPMVREMSGGRWFETDGVGGTMAVVSHALVVRHNQNVHRQIERLLTDLAGDNSEQTPGSAPEWLSPPINGKDPEPAAGAAPPAGTTALPTGSMGPALDPNPPVTLTQARSHSETPESRSGIAEALAGIPVQTGFSKNEQKIEEELQNEVNMEFPGNPLSDALTFIAQFHGIPIHTDESALADAGVALDTEISIVVSGIPLERALNLLLEDVGGVQLDYVIQDHVMKVTTAEEAERMRDIRVYDIRPLGLNDPSRLVELIEHTTDVQWSAEGDVGGSIEYVDGRLVIRQSQRGHRQVQDVLDLLLKTKAPASDSAAAASTPLPEWIPERAPFGPFAPAGNSR